MKLVYGKGINDAGYPVTINENSRQIWKCPYYTKWQSMLSRCYQKKELERNPSYRDKEVCEEWLTFSNFKCWVDSQECKDWQDRQLDKDFIHDSGVYSPETCVFVPQEVNKFLTYKKLSSASGKLIGTYLMKSGKFYGAISDGTHTGTTHLGQFSTELEAHLAWQAAKLVQLEDLISKYEDEPLLSFGLQRLKTKFTQHLKLKLPIIS